MGRLRYQSFVTATVRERSRRTDGLVPLRSLLWNCSVPTYKRATPYHFLRLPLSQKWGCSRGSATTTNAAAAPNFFPCRQPTAAFLKQPSCGGPRWVANELALYYSVVFYLLYNFFVVFWFSFIEGSSWFLAAIVYAYGYMLVYGSWMFIGIDKCGYKCLWILMGAYNGL